MPDSTTCWIDPLVRFIGRIWFGLGHPLQWTIVVGCLVVAAIWAWRRNGRR